MKAKNPLVSIIIITYNSGNNFKQTLDAIFSQKMKDFEVIIIDSSSTDNTLDIVKKYNTRIFKIKKEEFGHGKTRNFGANLAKGKYLVFMTQDAIPADKNWLSELIKSLNDEKVAGVYSRQIPKENENTIDKFFYLSLYPEKNITWKKEDIVQGNNIFSDVSSAMRKELFLKNTFNEKLILGEDYDWASRMLNKNLQIYYNSNSKVIHSHSYKLCSVFKRNFDIGVLYQTIYPSKNKQKGFFKKGTTILANELKYLAKKGKVYLVPYAILKDATKFIAINLGKNSNHLPTFINKRLSNYPRYWK